MHTLHFFNTNISHLSFFSDLFMAKSFAPSTHGIITLSDGSYVPVSFGHRPGACKVRVKLYCQ